jgi:ATP-dependent Lon protease
VLDEDHYDLDKVKERILEFLAVRKLRAGGKGPILCFVGPPGTGKTSLGRSIARAMGRQFHRLSLGGVRDEAEIRGHRRTYVGALPGQIIQALRKCGTRNPVLVLDEVDKLGADFRGDPASALLEVLDPEQNSAFVDHYIDLPFDLSKVLFLTTANILDTIPGPLLDRMEVLELPGYIDEEKVAIARRYLIPRQCRENGIDAAGLVIDDAVLAEIIGRYTAEAGLRNLEREIAKICRKIALRRAEGDSAPVTVTADNVEEFLGPRRITREIAERTAVPGVAIGMVWTPAGGGIVFVEATRMPGGKSLILTGQLGDVMRESAQAALSYVRSRAASLGIPKDFYQKWDLHLHVPAGAVPKDGPSAGVTMATAIASLLTGRPCRPDTSMTGEITLRGKVLPVGGIKQKVLGARRAGIRTVLLPAENDKDLKEIPKHVLEGLEFRFVGTVDEVLEAALLPASPRAGREAGAADAAPRNAGRHRAARRAGAPSP